MQETPALFTLGIVLVTALVSWRAFADLSLRDSLLLSTGGVLRDRQYHRIVTSGFVHADWAHLLFNMYSLYSFGELVEIVYGAPTLLAIYFASILGGSLLALGLHRGREYRALGASGGVCGVIFASVFLLPGGGVYVFMIPYAIPAWLYALLFIAFSFWGMRTRMGNIGHDAHLGGALVGLAVTLLLHPRMVLHSPRLLAAIVVMTLVLAFVQWRYPGGFSSLGNSRRIR